MDRMTRTFGVYLAVMYALPTLSVGGHSLRVAYLLLPLLVYMLAITGLMRRSLFSSLRIPSVLLLFLYTLYMTVPFISNKADLLPEATNFLLYWFSIVAFAVLFSDGLLNSEAGSGKADEFLGGVMKALLMVGLFMVFIGMLENVFPEAIRSLYSSKGGDVGFGERELGSFGAFSRISSTAGAPNNLGGVMSILSLLVLVQMTVGKAPSASNKAMFAAFITILLMAGSRGAVAGFVAGLGCLLLISGRFKHVAITLFVGLGIYLFAGDAMMDFFSHGYVSKRHMDTEGPASIVVRLNVWRDALEGWRSTGLANIALGNGFYNANLYQSLGLHGWHNSYMQVAYAVGLSGVLIVGLFIFYSIRGLVRGLSLVKGSASMKNGYPFLVFVTVAYVSVLVHSLADNVFLINTIVMGLFLPILCIGAVVAYKAENGEALR